MPSRTGRRVAIAAMLVAAATLAGCTSGDDDSERTPAADVVQQASGPAPTPSTVDEPGVIAALPAAPVLYGDRLRVLGLGDTVWAEPLTGATGAAAVWSYRRPGAGLVGFRIARANAHAAFAVTVWNDGLLAGVNVTSGAIAWRTDGPDLGRSAAAAWQAADPAGLLTVRGAAGDVAVLHQEDRAFGFDVASGRQLWTWDRSGTCPATDAGAPELWESGGYVVVNASCDEAQPVVLVLDPRTGKETANLHPRLPWPAGQRPRVSAIGCTGGRAGCTVFGIAPATDGGRLRPLAWRVVGAGRAVPVAARTLAADHGRFAVSDFQLAIVTPDGRPGWRVSAPAGHRDTPQFTAVDSDGGPVWVASGSWNGGPAAIVGLDPGTGRVTSCAAPPRGAPVRFLDAQGRYLVIGDADGIGKAPTGTVPDDAFALVLPDTRKRGCA